MEQENITLSTVSNSYQTNAQTLIDAIETYNEIIYPEKFTKIISQIKEITDSHHEHKEASLDDVKVLKPLIEKAENFMLMNQYMDDRCLSLSVRFINNIHKLYKQEYTEVDLELPSAIRPKDSILPVFSKIALAFQPIYLYGHHPVHFSYTEIEHKENGFTSIPYFSDPYEFPSFLCWIDYWSREIVARTPFHYETDKDLFYRCEVLPNGGLLFQVSEGSLDLNNPDDSAILSRIFERLIIPAK